MWHSTRTKQNKIPWTAEVNVNNTTQETPCLHSKQRNGHGDHDDIHWSVPNPYVHTVNKNIVPYCNPSPSLWYPKPPYPHPTTSQPHHAAQSLSLSLSLTKTTDGLANVLKYTWPPPQLPIYPSQCTPQQQRQLWPFRKGDGIDCMSTLTTAPPNLGRIMYCGRDIVLSPFFHKELHTNPFSFSPNHLGLLLYPLGGACAEWLVLHRSR